jgi:hypothetical protein
MPWESIKLVPGLNTGFTQTLRAAGYSATALVRFKNGLVQKLGGWAKYYANSVGTVPRALHAYQDLNSTDRVVVGGTTKLYDLASSALRNITPQQITTSVAESFDTTSGSAVVQIDDAEVGTVTAYNAVTFLTPVAVGGLVLHGTYQITNYISATAYTITASANATGNVTNGGAVPTFTTASGSATVTVTLVAHGLAAGEEVVFHISTTVGGVTISGRYVVQTVPTADTFTITTTTSASSTAGPTSMNGGEASFLYHVTIGPQATGGAYGAGLYGAGTYGKGAALSATAGTDITVTDWSLDNWSELLIACAENGGLYWWSAATGYQNAQLLSPAPIYNTGAFVSMAEQVVMAYGSTTYASIGEYHDPLLVRWCNTGDFFTWSALATFRIPTGSACIGGAATPQRNLIWTDVELWSVDFIGPTMGYGFNKIGSNCGLIAKHAHAQLSGVVYWMSPSNFFAMSGNGVSAIPCTVWDDVFQDLDTTYQSLCFAAPNTAFSEICWYYPSASGAYGYCDKYAKLNTMTGEWDSGTLQRNAWVDRTVLNNPIGITNGGLIYNHESGYDADGMPLEASFETGYFAINEGEDIAFVDRIFPDFKWGTAGGDEDAIINITVKTVMHSGETPKTYGPFAVTKASPYISKRFRARYVAFIMSSSDLGSFWRLGDVKMRYAIDGRR